MARKDVSSGAESGGGGARADISPPLDTEVVMVNIKEDRRHLAAVGEEFGTYFLELTVFNPDIRNGILRRGTHRIKIPRPPRKGRPRPLPEAAPSRSTIRPHPSLR